MKTHADFEWTFCGERYRMLNRMAERAGLAKTSAKRGERKEAA